MSLELSRCSWADSAKPAYVRYHDEEWGVPLEDEQRLFELLSLEAFQAGLSWWTILSRREAFRRVFAEFDAVQIAAFTSDDVERLRQDASIVRHRGKIEATIGNAQALLALRDKGESFHDLLWSVVGGVPLVNRPSSMLELPSRSEHSDRLSALLRARGFRFVGSTICYAFMQAAGLIDDHVATCFRALEVPL